MKAGTLITLLSAVAMATQASADEPKKPDTAIFKITPEMFARGDIHVHEICSIDMLRLRGTPLQGRVEAFCKAVEGQDAEYHERLDLCRKQKEKRNKELEEKAPTLNEDQKTDFDIQNQISDAACQNLVILGHYQKIGDLFRKHFPGGVTLGYFVP